MSFISKIKPPFPMLYFVTIIVFRHCNSRSASLYVAAEETQSALPSFAFHYSGYPC